MFFGYVAFNQFWYTPFLRALQVANLSGMCCLSVCVFFFFFFFDKVLVCVLVKQIG